MVLFDGVAGLIFVGLWIFCIIDVITTPESRCRNLPKIAWLLIVILLVDVGSIAWLVARPHLGRPTGQIDVRAPRHRHQAEASNPDDDEEFLAGLRARAEEQRRRARERPRRTAPRTRPADLHVLIGPAAACRRTAARHPDLPLIRDAVGARRRRTHGDARRRVLARHAHADP